MSYNSYNGGKFGSYPQTSQMGVEVSQDMHLKMSKKIAQLTKVSLRAVADLLINVTVNDIRCQLHNHIYHTMVLVLS